MFVEIPSDMLVIFVCIRDKREVFRVRHDGMLILPECILDKNGWHLQSAYTLKERYFKDKKSWRLEKVGFVRGFAHGNKEPSSWIFAEAVDSDMTMINPDAGEWIDYHIVLERNEVSPLTHRVYEMLREKNYLN